MDVYMLLEKQGTKDPAEGMLLSSRYVLEERAIPQAGQRQGAVSTTHDWRGLLVCGGLLPAISTFSFRSTVGFSSHVRPPPSPPLSPFTPLVGYSV